MLDTARAFLYVRNEPTAPTVVRGLSDGQWRVRHGSLKKLHHRRTELAAGEELESRAEGAVVNETRTSR
jgi:hypothetical protein